MTTLYHLLIGSRYPNRIYVELAKARVMDFDQLFAVMDAIEWRRHLPRDVAIVTEAMALKSTLSHTPTLQSIMKKAIVTHLTRGQDSHHLFENRTGREAHIQLFLLEDEAHIGLDVTGFPIHRRGYRSEAGDAPIKENLAAALVAFSGWRFREQLYDPFCGSGTIVIEAAMLARNIAPGLDRRFAIEWHPFFDKEVWMEVKHSFREKIYPSGAYEIFASDMDAEVIEKAKNNARRAGVEKDITFLVSDFREGDYDHDPLWIITNPPYGERLESTDTIYDDLRAIFARKNISGGIITSANIWEDRIDKKLWKDRKLYNGNIPTRLWMKRKDSLSSSYEGHSFTRIKRNEISISYR